MIFFEFGLISAGKYQIPMTRSFLRMSNLMTSYLYKCRVSQKKVSIKTFVLTCSLLEFTVFEFIWIQYICKFCSVYHLKDLDASRKSYSSFSETYVFFKRANSVEKQLLNFRNTSVSHCFGISSLTIIWNNLGLSNYKRM